MFNLTPLVRPHFRSRLEEQLRYISHPEAVQRGQWMWLIEHAALTEYGRRYDYSALRTYEAWAERVPLNTYTTLQPAIERMMRGQANVLWPGITQRFAQSSGTTGSRSKFIPVTDDSLRRNHYRGAADAVAHYLNLNPQSRLFSGKALILGGSFNPDVSAAKNVRVGDLSATLINRMPRLAALLRVPAPHIALMVDWNAKLPALVNACLHQNITNLSGVPSWMLAVLRQVLQQAGTTSLHDVWPNLEVFFHGGIAFQPYRQQYEQICDMSRMHFLENYNASEGFFAVQSSWDSNAMMLLLDVGVFYEFIPIADVASEQPHALPLWEVAPAQTYELVITACNGLWRYRLGDTITVQQLNPMKITIAGRTKTFINAFGEELMEHHAEQAIAAAAAATGAQVANYTAAPVFTTEHRRGRHQWFVEFSREPRNYSEFAQRLDDELRRACSDYDAKRSGDLFLDTLDLVVVPEGIFNRWLAATGKLGGQRKVPRLSNDRHLADTLLKMLPH